MKFFAALAALALSVSSASADYTDAAKLDQ
jgi:hypothetical protein